ncbi:MAG: efflux RND transporter periplasmic adaptor subunit [Campylobacteraceae bacterium]|nr:efflux RND transporter periplasmic adaptor subunit [Campylobacteraceae bacterium]
MKKYIIIVALIILGAFGFYKKVYIPKHTFITTQATKGNINIKVNGVGNVGARDIYKIGSLYGGKLLDFSVQEGEYIKKDTLIVNVDSVDLVDKIDEQKALKSKLLNDINSLKVDRQSAKVNFDYQNELFNKNKKLYKLRSISSLDYQKYLTAKDTAKLKIDSISANIVSLKDQILQVQSGINGLEVKLAHYIIEVPVSGYITKKLIVNYQIIMPNQTLIEMVNPRDVWVQTYIDTRISGKVKIGDSASIKLRSSDKIYRGKVVNINPVNNPITYEREIDVAFDNLPIPFYLEEQAVVKIDIGALKNIVKVPTKALSIYKEKNGVWILKGDRVKFKPLEILAYENKTAAVRGLSIDEKLVIPDSKKNSLSDGMKIYHD